MADEASTKKALLQIVREHNGWLDFDGTPFPAATDTGEFCTKAHPEGPCPEAMNAPVVPATEEEIEKAESGVVLTGPHGQRRAGFWEAIPDELAAAVIVLARLESGKLATSLIPNQRRR
jgi:hypothetical protein